MSNWKISLLNGKVHYDVNKCINCEVCVHHYLEEDWIVERTEIKKEN